MSLKLKVRKRPYLYKKLDFKLRHLATLQHLELQGLLVLFWKAIIPLKFHQSKTLFPASRLSVHVFVTLQRFIPLIVPEATTGLALQKSSGSNLGIAGNATGSPTYNVSPIRRSLALTRPRTSPG